MDAKEAVQKFVDENPSLLEELKEAYGKFITQQEDILSGLLIQKSDAENKRKEMYAEEKLNGYSREGMNARQELSMQINKLSLLIISQQNVVLAIKNGGDLASFTDKKGERHENIPSLLKVETTVIAFDEETILVDPTPPYLPIINEEIFKSKGYVFDSIRLSPDEYILAVHGYKEIDTTIENGEIKKSLIVVSSAEQGYVLVTLDQLVLINDYYYTKAKAIEQKSALESTKRQEDYYDKQPEERRQSVFNQRNFYQSLPSAVKKKVTVEKWDTLSLSEKESFYKPHKKYGPKRLKAKLDDQHMWLSFHNMYERFVNPEYISPKRGFAHPEVFAYWAQFREMMKWKLNDIKVQREIDSENYKTAIETSFGESNTNDTLVGEYGILVKRQNGDKINLQEIEQIQIAWALVQSTFGYLKDMAVGCRLKISHTGTKLVFASKAVGMYLPKQKTISVSAKSGNDQFGHIMAHETAHFIDNILGSENGKRYLSDDFEGTAGRIASFLRKNMNEKTESEYLNATKECFARALEQHFAISVSGEGAELIASTEKSRIRTYFTEGAYLNQKAYNEIKPMIEEFLAKYLKPKQNDILESIPQRIDRTNDEINIRNEEIAGELRKRIRKAQEDAGVREGEGDFREIDNEIAYSYAKENNLWIDDLYSLGRPFTNGNENTNAFNEFENKVYKSNSLSNSISMNNLFEKIRLHNLFFPNTTYDFIGFTGIINTGNGKPYVEPIYSQDFIKEATYATQNEISDYMINIGFEKLTPSKFKKDHIEVSDLHPRNVLKDKNGDIYVIDAEFKNLKKEQMEEKEYKFPIGTSVEIIDDVKNKKNNYEVVGHENYNEYYGWETKIKDVNGEVVTMFENLLEPKTVEEQTEIIEPMDETITVVYPNIKSCLLAEGDEESHYIYEGKQFVSAGEKWEITGFFKYGVIITHLPKHKLHDKKDERELTFTELRELYSLGDLDIFGIDSLAKLNHCIKLIEKCIDMVDLSQELATEKEAHNKTKESLPKEFDFALSKTEPIYINMPALGTLPERNVKLIYDQDNFIYDIFDNGEEVGVMGEKKVIENIENGMYIITQEPAAIVLSPARQEIEIAYLEAKEIITEFGGDMEELENNYKEALEILAEVEK